MSSFVEQLCGAACGVFYEIISLEAVFDAKSWIFEGRSPVLLSDRDGSLGDVFHLC